MPSSPMSQLQAFAFGRLCRDATFSAEVVFSGNWNVKCDTEKREVEIYKPGDLILGAFRGPTTSIKYPAHRIIGLASTPRSDTATHYRVFIEAHSPPLFERTLPATQLFSSTGDKTTRLPSPDGTELPPVHKCVCLRFTTPDDQEKFLKSCKKLHLPRHSEVDLPVVQKYLYCQDNLIALEGLYHRLCWSLAFEVQKSFYGSLLDPIELLNSLEAPLIRLQQTSESQAILVFRQFISSLKTPTLARTRRRRRRRARPITREDLTLPSVTDSLREAIREYHARARIRSNIFTPAPTLVQSYHVVITPSSKFLEGPYPDRGNVVLRRFGHHEHFLRICLSDESRARLYNRVGLHAGGSVGSRYLDVMVNGFTLAGRKWEFLGYSMSGLREHSVWFVNPFKSDEDPNILIDASRIRSRLGNFTSLEHKPARLGARWSQAFTTTDPSVTLEPAQIKRIDDKRSANDSSVFTDGCGAISPTLAHEVWEKFQMSRRKTSRARTPSCFQIRLGGAKGVVVQDTNLTDKVICLRPSQIKFDAPESLTLDIAATSARPSPLFLNRPLIVLLEYLGVRPRHILALQQEAIRQVDTASSSLSSAPALLQQYGLGESFRLSSLFTNIFKYLKLDVGVSTNLQYLDHELIKDCLRCANGYVLRGLKFRARIPVPGSYTLFGVSDEADCLKEGQIYATVADERTGLYQRITGKVLITRSPQIHPGDMQFVEAVDHPALRHLTNVVVFSCRGRRSLPSCLGGGDLDGDVYNLILDGKLWPSRTKPPGDYVSLRDKVTPNPCTIKDIAEFILDYIKSDQLGYISILHLRFSDLKDPGCPECLTLANLASQAVDFPKTGTPVNFRSIPLPPPREACKPDFLCPEGSTPDPRQYYQSQKVLGILYRSVPTENRHHDEEVPTSPPIDDQTISEALDRLRSEVPQLPNLPDPSDELWSEMVFILHQYIEQLSDIARRHSLSQNPNHSLTEAELVSGTIDSTWSNNQRGRQEAVTAMNFQTHELVTGVLRRLEKMEPDALDADEDDDVDRDNVGGPYERSLRDAETMARSWAAWLVSIAELRNEPDAFGPQSFGLIALGSLLKVVKEVVALAS